MAIHFSAPRTTELKPRIVVFGVGGAGGIAVNNMIEAGLLGVEFVVANTDAQQLAFAKTDRGVQLGVLATQGLGAGAHPEIGMEAAEESIPEIGDHLDGAHMVFITAGMGGGTGTGAPPIIAKCARERGILTVGGVTKPFHFQGRHRMGLDMTLLEVDEAANAISEQVDPEANIIFGAAFDPSLDGMIRVSVVATGMDGASIAAIEPKLERRPMTAPPLRLTETAAELAEG